MEAFIPPSRELPGLEQRPLLPTAHVHLFWRVVLLATGSAAIVAGLVMYILGVGDATWPGVELAKDVQVKAMLYALASALLLSVGVLLCVVWALWTFIKKYRYRFLFALSIGALGIIVGLLSGLASDVRQPLQFTINFFLLSLGIFMATLSLAYLFMGYSRHLFGAHHEEHS